MSLGRTRLVSMDDVPVLTRLAVENREFLAPWDPVRPDDFFTEDCQSGAVIGALARHADGTALPQVILDDDGEIVGRITLNGIVRGPFQSCSVGYWVSRPANGRGLATSAVGDVVRIAFEELGLHRVQGETLLHNLASQRVLARNGFERIGMAPKFLEIAGRWQDHLLFQRLAVGSP